MYVYTYCVYIYIYIYIIYTYIDGNNKSLNSISLKYSLFQENNTLKYKITHSCSVWSLM